jgi:predicted acylesterase/phospholipase RssA
MSKTVLLLFLSLVCLYNCFNKTSNSCLILSLEGGGDRGAYQAGALKAFVDKLAPQDVQYDIYSGISVGSLNSAGLSFFKKGDEVNAVNFLLNTWRNISSHTSIFENWNYFSVFYSAFFEPGLFSTAPLRSLLNGILTNHTVQRNFTFGMTNLGTGNFDVFTDEHLRNITKEEVILAILSSSAIPILFPHIEFNNQTYADGGLSAKVDITTGISLCRNNGFKDEDIVVDIVMLSVRGLTQIDPNGIHPISVVERAAELMYYDVFYRNLDEITHVFPNVKIRYLVIPSKELASGRLPVRFVPSEMEDMIKQGINDAADVIRKGEGVVFREEMEKYHERKYERIIKIGGKHSEAKKFLQ